MRRTEREKQAMRAYIRLPSRGVSLLDWGEEQQRADQELWDATFTVVKRGRFIHTEAMHAFIGDLGVRSSENWQVMTRYVRRYGFRA